MLYGARPICDREAPWPTADGIVTARQGPWAFMERPRPELPFTLSEDERLEVAAHTDEAVLAVTDRRMVVASPPHRTVLDLPIEAIRRVQFDVERGRPATLVVVPHEPEHQPQVLSVPLEELEAAARAVYVIGYRLQQTG